MKNTHILIVILLMIASCMQLPMQAQSVVLKSNTLGWATASPNLELEISLSPKWTFDLYGSVNPFTFSESKRWKHWLVQPEARYWLCETFQGHFFGIHLLGGQYNLGKVSLPFGIYDQTKENRYEGWGVGSGISYGYQWIFSRHWSFEATIGAGYIYSQFEKYPCATCGTRLDKGDKHYFGITKAGLSLVYAF